MDILENVIAFWQQPENKPFKGGLVSYEEIERGKNPINCLCAQGQILHVFGGYEIEEMGEVSQQKADKEVAAILSISKAHSILIRIVNDTEKGAPINALNNPELYLGPNYKKVLSFWSFIESLGEKVIDVPTDKQDYQCELGKRASETNQNYFMVGDCITGSIDYQHQWIKRAAKYATYELMIGEANPVYLPLFGDFQ